VPIHNGTFDLAMHRWYDPFERVLGLAAARGVALSTPRMGERLDLTAPHRGERWWRNAMEVAEAPQTSRGLFARLFSCNTARRAEPGSSA
jgi:hypothetical protein